MNSRYKNITSIFFRNNNEAKLKVHLSTITINIAFDSKVLNLVGNYFLLKRN